MTMRLLALALLLPGAVRAQSTHLLVVAGLGGEAAYSARFRGWALALDSAARVRYGMPDSEVVVLTEDGAGSPRVAGSSTKDRVEQALTAFQRRAGPGDQLVIVLIGHGSGEGAGTKISLPGPDLDAGELARLLAPPRWPTQRIAVVDLTSASGDALAVLSAPNRVVITATKSAFERNESQFARHFVDALAGTGPSSADTDKDGRVSLLEAFRYAAAATRREYEQASHLLTEHAQLDDDGDGKGAADPDGKTGDGLLARRVFLGGGTFASREGANDPRLASLYRDRFALEEQLDALKRRKPTMTPDAYDDALEQTLVTLARTSRQIRGLEGRR